MNNLKQRQAKLVELFHGAPIARSMGMRLSYDAEERAVFTMPYNPAYDHALQGVHGGVFATMLDNAGWFTVAAHFDSWLATVEFQVRLLEPVNGQDLWSRGEIVRMGKKLCVAKMEVRTTADTLVAIGSGTFMVIPKLDFSEPE